MIFQNKNFRKVTLFIFVFICVSVFSFSQDLTVDEIISKNIEARGGSDNWSKVETIKTTGIYVNFSIPEKFVLLRKKPNLYRFETNRINKFTIHAFDGKKCWWVNPLMGEQFAKPSFIPDANNLDKVTLRERFFEPVFWNYKTKGNKVELLGKEDLDGDEVYKIKVTLADKSEELWFINAETFLEVSMKGQTYDFGVPNSLTMFFSDYQEINGVQLPYLIESEYGIRYRSMEIEKIEINENVSDKDFVKPDPKTWKK